MIKRFRPPRARTVQSSVLNVLFTLFLVTVFSACGDTKGAAKKSDIEEFAFAKSLYVTNAGDGSLLVFDPPVVDTQVDVGSQKPVPRVSEGNISPSRRFPDAFNGPADVYLDLVNDTLYVANAGQNSISIYEKISLLAPPVAASRVISGDQTLLNQPFGVAYDATHDQLYVANRDGNTVVAFSGSCIEGAALQGNIAPCHLLRLSGDDKAVQLDLPRAVTIDMARDILYISNMGSDSILAYDHASTDFGGAPSACETDFTPCNKPPDRIISPFTNVDQEVINTLEELADSQSLTGDERSQLIEQWQQVRKLELPFGVFIDSVNNRLYVANTGLNTPGILIYENASTRDGGAPAERVITSQIPQLPLTCSPSSDPTPELPLPSECSLTQLTVPAGIDVDVAGDRVFVINNNSPNNVNQSSSGNVDSPTLVVFNNIATRCLLGGNPICPLNPDRRVGGDTSPEAGTTLAAPLGLAIDSIREITYIANTGGNNLLSYSLSGDIAPIKRNASVESGIEDLTDLEEPASFFYDEDNDRLYVGNHIRSFTNTSAVVVYDEVSTISFSDAPSNIPPSWAIEGDGKFDLIRGFYVDEERGYLLVLSGSSGPRLSIYCIKKKTDGEFNDLCKGSILPNVLWESFPGNSQTAPLISAPDPLITFSDGFGVSGPASMAVDQALGIVYIADEVAKKIFTYDLKILSSVDPPVGQRIIDSPSFSKPHGIGIDSTRDILYVTDVTQNTILSFDGASGLTGSVVAARIVTSDTLAPADALGSPVAPFIDTTADRLYLVNVDSNAIFTYDQASTITGETAPSGQISGPNTLLDFSPPLETPALTGALIVTQLDGNQTLFVGQPESPDCEGGADECQPGALLIYGIQGRVAPSKVFSGGDGGFSLPSAVAVDGNRKILYVSNQETDVLSVLKNADTLDVNSPVAVKMDLTGIQLNHPAGIAIDSVQNILFVSNSASTNCTVGPCNAVLVFKNPDTLLNGTAPDQSITHEQLNDPRGLALDSEKARLYIASRGSNAVLIYAIDGGTATLEAVLSGAGSELNRPIGVGLDPTTRFDPETGALDPETSDLLYVLNEETQEVLVFKGASTLSGNAAPVRRITGSDPEGKNNLLTSPSAIAVDPVNDLLYLSDAAANAVYIVLDASLAKDQDFDKTLSGDKTGLFNPTALAVDTAE